MAKSIKRGSNVKRSFVFSRENINSDDRTVELAFSSEEPYERWWGREILDHSPKSIRMGRLMSGAPLLSDHDNSIRSQIGVVESVSIGADRVGRAVVRFGKGAADDEIFQKVQDGIIRNVSVGYIIHDATIIETRDGIDTYRVMDWEPLEISLVAVPADNSVGVGRSLENSQIFIEDAEDMTEEIRAPNVEEIQRRAAEEAQRAISAERKRVADILAIGKDHANVGGVELASRAIESSKTVQEFQSEILDAIRKHTEKPMIHHGEAARIEDNAPKDKKAGFRNLGDFCHAVKDAGVGRSVDERLSRAATTFGMEASGPEGGYAIPPEFAQNIVNLALEEQSLLSMVDGTPISGNTMTFPKDEGTPWGSSGIQAYWEGEGATLTQTKESELKESTLRLKKLTCLVGATDELLADATAMSSYITRKMGIRLDWKIQDAIVNGIGSGQPLGITKSSAFVSQAKETSQTADTINGNNVAKMLGRVIQGAGANIVWLINPDAYNQLITMTLNNNPVWTPPNSGFKNAPDGLLLGKPVLQTDTCQTLGDKFDVILANLNGYQAITKAGGAELATSMHLWFDQSVMAFRLIFRMDGKPLLSGPVTPPNSSVTRAHFVTLDART